MLALLLVASACTASTQKWAGTITFPPYAADEALNITVNTAANTAEIAWVFDKSGAGIICYPHVETNLKVSIVPNHDGSNTSTVHLLGDGTDPEYYSFAANLSADGQTLTGGIVGFQSHFQLKLNAPQVPSACKGPAPAPPPTAQLPVWPQPSSWTAGTGVQELDAKQFVFSYAAAHPTTDDGATPNTLAQAFERYTALTTPHRPSPAAAGAKGALRSLVVSVADPSEDAPQQGTNENYTLVIPGGGAAAATLDAATVYGALRGLETFSQLVLFNFSSSTYSVAGVPLTVVDAPRFTHRGIMADTSRHFLTVAMLYRLLDSMSYAKLNVLHWHIVDDQSFPMEVNSYPNLQGLGAYSARERYSRLDAADLVEYARLRGIRVMLEIDTPSHTACWCRGYPGVCPPKPCKDGITRTPLDPSTNDTFTMIQGILEELSPLFPETLLHVGQDEVDVGCWSEAQNPTIGAWQKEHGFATPDEAYVYTANRIEAGVRSLATPKRAVQWWPGLCLGEPTGARSCGKPTGFCPCRGVINGDGSQPKPGLDRSTVLQLWEGNGAIGPGRLDWNKSLAQVVAAGFAVIQSTGFYINAGDLKTTWETYYMNELMTNVTKESEKKLVLGGEACMWGEFIDGSNLLNTVWPRTAAIAERLWSPRDVNNTATAKPRLAQFRFLLQARGIPAGVLDFTRSSSYGLPEAGQPPDGPGSCLKQ